MSAETVERARPQPHERLSACPTHGIEWLIDNAVTYKALVAAIREARTSIWISQLALDADCVAYDVGGGDGVRLVDELLVAAERGVKVCVLLNASLLLDTAKPLRAHLAATGADPEQFRVRGVRRFPQLLHAKLVIVDDDVAFLVGSPFANGYWDDDQHPPMDARRPMRELGGRPVHDLSVQVTGPTVAALRSTFVELWNDAGDVDRDDTERLHAGSPVPPPAIDPPISIVRTAPDDGPMEILPALLRGIASARSLIYVEHQYLSARLIVDALTRALERHSALEIIVVLNQNPDVTAYRGWQNERLRESGLLQHPRMGAFSLWTSAVAAEHGRRQLSQLFVHSKLVAIDDRWALVGSANLDGVSLHSYGADFSSALGRRIFRHVRNFDIGLVLGSHGPAPEPCAQVHQLRASLWREHLGLSASAVRERPTSGWLPLWRSIAQRNVDALNRPDAGVTRLSSSFVLPYSMCSSPRAQLADVGVLLAPRAVELCFEPSWLEVHCSPSWVRNMFG